MPNVRRAALCALLAAAAPSRAQNLQAAQKYCAEVNAHWVGGSQQCACNAGYVQSGSTCVLPAATGGSTGGAPPSAAGSVNSAIVGGAGSLLGGLLTTHSNVSAYQHVPVKPAVDASDGIPADPGAGDAQDIIGGYHPPEISGGGTTVAGMPVLTGNIEDIEAFLQGKEALQRFRVAAGEMLHKMFPFGKGKAKESVALPPDKKPDADAANGQTVDYAQDEAAYQNANPGVSTGFERLDSQKNFFNFGSGKNSNTNSNDNAPPKQ
jgi:hypothetical protein